MGSHSPVGAVPITSPLPGDRLNMFNVRTVDPSIEPVDVTTQKAFMRLTTSSDDALITTFISAAREYVELQTKLAMITQTWKLTLDEFPSQDSGVWWDGTRDGALSSLNTVQDWIELPTGPLIAVTSFSTFNAADTPTLFTGFYTDTARRPGRVALRSGSVWPVATRGVNGIEIVYTAGFGPAANNVPADLRIAISQIASHWYENREIMTFDIAARDVPQSAERIIKSRKVLKV